MSRVSASIRARPAVLGAACLLVACGGEEPRRALRAAGGAEGAARPGAEVCGAGPASHDSSTAPRPVVALQLAALADSGRAAALRDSLARRGWAAYVRDGAGRARWRVRVAAGADSLVARRVAAALAGEGWRPTLLGDTAVAAPAAVRVHRVGGITGMAARVRWVASPDGCMLLVVHDPVGVENEPIPNAFLLASERLPAPGILVRVERSWDVAPSPDWTRLAYGRAFLLHGRERDSVPTAEWDSVAREAGLPAEEVRRGAFPASAMSLAYGLAQPVVVALDGAGEPQPLPATGGWRVAWADGGRALALGAAPERAQDDAPAARWRLVDPATGAAFGSDATGSGANGGDASSGEAPALDSAAAAAWRQGPVIDISVPADSGALPVPVSGGRVESGGGWIALLDHSSPRRRVVGPGSALAATRGGRFVVALAPRLPRKSYEPPTELVVYEVAR